MTTVSSSSLHYAAAAATTSVEHRQRCCNNKGSSVEGPSPVASAAAAAAARTLTTSTTSTSEQDADEDDLDYADQKYDKRAKARLQKRLRRRKAAASSQHSYGIFSSSSSGKPPSVAQMAGLLLLFTALLSMWHYMRTVWWTHGRLAAVRRQAQLEKTDAESHMNIYQLAEARIKEHHFLFNKPGHTAADDKNNDAYRQRHEQQEHKRLKRQQQQQRLQPQQPRGDDGAASSNRREDQSSSNSRRRRRANDDQEHSPPRGRDEEEEMEMDELKNLSTYRLQQLFLEQRRATSSNSLINVEKILGAWLHQLNRDMLSNMHGGIRWIRPYLLPPLPGLSKPDDDEQHQKQKNKVGRIGNGLQLQKQFFRVDRLAKTKKAADEASAASSQFKWEDEWNDLIQQQQGKHDSAAGANNDIDLQQDAGVAQKIIARKLAQPVVDYTAKDKYRYPPLLEEPPEDGGYPQMTSLASMMEHWDQDEDFHGTITETLLHFNYSDPNELEMARKFRDSALPFKLTNVPELDAANVKWTDEYVSKQFDRPMKPRGYLKHFFHSDQKKHSDPDLQAKPASGLAQESPNHYFAFFTPPNWHVETMGLPPVRNSDWTFAKWSEHAKYADAVRLSPDQPHFYWQVGVEKEERHRPESEWTFISRELPSWSSKTETFMVFEPKSQKGIQCRFGERGVVAATHYDSGRNMVGMITGAKRYILSPPKACSKLGIFTHPKSPIYRHSLLNFGHLKYLHDHGEMAGDNEENTMSMEERAWLERASQATAVETVLKAGEVLYIPSHWFHYIISLQKSAQCNVRSGVDLEGSEEFGGHEDVVQCVD